MLSFHSQDDAVKIPTFGKGLSTLLTIDMETYKYQVLELFSEIFGLIIVFGCLVEVRWIFHPTFDDIFNACAASNCVKVRIHVRF